MRVGFGYDSHRLVPGRQLVLGGVTVPSDKGLDGWTDADVIVHAIIDALCGAAGLGDIGVQFPSGDEEYHNAASIDLLRVVVECVHAKGLRVFNLDVSVLAEAPLLAPYVGLMRQSLAEATRVAEDDVSVKPKTNEGMGFVGRGEGIAAYAVALIVPGESSSRT